MQETKVKMMNLIGKIKGKFWIYCNIFFMLILRCHQKFLLHLSFALYVGIPTLALNLLVSSPVGSNFASMSFHNFGFFSVRCKITFFVCFLSTSVHALQPVFNVFGRVVRNSRPSLVHGPEVLTKKVSFKWKLDEWNNFTCVKDALNVVGQNSVISQNFINVQICKCLWELAIGQ